MQRKQPLFQARPSPLRLGFVPLNDCAPMVMAREMDLFPKHGIHVELHREAGWASVRDKVIYGELDAAHAPAGMVVAASAGLGSIRADCVTGLVINLHGNAITLSQDLWRRGVRDVAGLKGEIERLRGRDKFTFGVVFPFSSHNFLLRSWLRSGGIDPDRDVRIVVVPPPQMFPNLKAGNLDGYCVGEPWNSVAVMKRAGFVVKTSGELADRHPEKVLMVRRDFALEHEREHLAMIAALIESCRFCDAPENRERIVETLARPGYLNAPVHAIRMSMLGAFDFGNGRVEKDVDFHVFSNHGANEPCAAKAAWVMRSLQESRAATSEQLDGLRPEAMFRTDIYRRAHAMTQTKQTRDKTRARARGHPRVGALV